MIIKQLLTEFIGTFIFLGVILTTGQAFPIGLALATAIFFGGDIYFCYNFLYTSDWNVVSSATQFVSKRC